MSMQQVEYKFPDEADIEADIEIDIEPSSAEPVQDPRVKAQPEPELETEVSDEIEVVDDTPEEDRGRTPSEPPEDITEEELESYSEKVRKRLSRFSKGYHDERRAKEAAIRERDELERLTRQLYARVQEIEGDGNKSRAALLEQARRNVDMELNAAREEYRRAYEAGDTDAVLEAQEKLTSAKWRAEQLQRAKVPSSLQEESAPVQQQPQEQVRQTPQVDERAVAWQKENTWFGVEDEMTAFALGVHQNLVKNGVNPKSDEYYEQINARMRKTFPEYFGEEQEAPRPAPSRSTTSVVAPASRSKASKKIRLTKTQVALAKRLNVPLEEYAKQVAAEMRKSNG